MGLDTVFIPHPINMRTYEMVILASSGGVCSVYRTAENCVRSIRGKDGRERDHLEDQGILLEYLRVV